MTSQAYGAHTLGLSECSVGYISRGTDIKLQEVTRRTTSEAAMRIYGPLVDKVGTLARISRTHHVVGRILVVDIAARGNFMVEMVHEPGVYLFLIYRADDDIPIRVLYHR